METAQMIIRAIANYKELTGEPGEKMNNQEHFDTFAEFYPFYLNEHTNRVSRQLHFTGTSIALALIIFTFVTQTWWLLVIALIQGYAFAWVGHYFFERNRPATFRHPVFSFMGDWRLWWEMVTGKIPL